MQPSLKLALHAFLSRLPRLHRAARLAAFRRDELRLRALRAPHAFRPGAPTVVGFLSAPIGLGALARMNVSAMRALRLAPTGVDVSSAFGLPPLPGEEEADAEARAASEARGPVLLHVNPPELPRALRHAGVPLLRKRWLIGYWAWELPELDPSWHRAFAFLDEVWVPSSFTARALGERPPVPVRVVPPAVPAPLPCARSRADLGLPPDAFVLLSAFDMRSSMARKNPLGAIRAFRKAMGSRRDALLVVKVSHPEHAPAQFAELRRAAADAPNVRLLTRLLDAQTMSDLVQLCDGVLSLHRAEGYGLLLAEAMRRGRCVVATDWSGSRDFLSAENSLPVRYALRPVRDAQGVYRSQGGRLWAEPDLDDAAERIRALASQPLLRARLGERARRDAEARFAPEAFLQAAGGSLRRCVAAPAQAAAVAPQHGSVSSLPSNEALC